MNPSIVAESMENDLIRFDPQQLNIKRCKKAYLKRPLHRLLVLPGGIKKLSISFGCLSKCSVRFNLLISIYLP